MTNELVLSTKDLTEAGINSQLNTNDLVEVVAHDIYNKYVEQIEVSIKNGERLQKEYYSLCDPELKNMKAALGKYLKKGEVITQVDEDVDEDDLTGVSSCFGKVEEYWPYVTCANIKLVEKDKGTLVDKEHRNFNLPNLNLKNKKAAVKLTISTPTESTDVNVKEGGIFGKIETTVKKSFTKTLSIPVDRFRRFQQKVKDHNLQVQELMKFLPKNGLLSVERFTREARVKMNKKIISAQSPDFRKKISELFNIKL